MKKIMLDAGHYGKTNQSPCNKSYYESEMTWKLQRYLVNDLANYEVQVDRTRDNQEVDMPVYNRGQKAKGYDLFLSLHSNAVASSKKDGCDRPVIIYPILNKKNQSDKAKQFAEVIRNTMQTVQQGQIMVRAFPNNDKLDYYGVLRGAVSVGCENAYILEHSFHTDTRATNWLLDDENLKKLAKAEAILIAKLLDLKSIPQEEDMPRYQKADDIPDTYWRDYCKQLINDGVLKGDENGNLDITIDMLRVIKITSRM